MSIHSIKRRANRVGIAILALMAATVTAGEIDGFTEPYREIELAASESGTLATLLVEEGDSIGEGQRVGGLDDEVLRASVEIAEQAMKSEGKLRSAYAKYRLQKERMAKIGGLRQRDHASQAEFEQVSSEYEIAAADVQSIREDLLVRKLEHKQMKAQLQRRQIVSPISGIVTEIQKDQGEFVSASDPVVMRIVQLDPLQIVFSVPSELGHHFRRGETVTVEMGDRRERVKAQVVYVSPAGDAQSGTVPVKVRVPNPRLERQSGELCHLPVPDLPAPPSQRNGAPKEVATRNR